MKTPVLREEAKGAPRIIDVHGHPPTAEGMSSFLPMRAKLNKYLYHQDITTEEMVKNYPKEDEMIADLRKYNIAYMHVAADAETHLGGKATSNDYVAGLRDKYPDVYLSMWGSVDPWKGQQALREAERCIKELKLIGLKFHGPTAQFHVNDKQFYPLWDLCQELHAPVQFHMGYSGMGSYMPGGGGIKLKHTRPIDVDDVAADFPNLKIICMHNGEPWVEELIAVAMHKGNVYRETSGIWPKYFDERQVYEMSRRLKDKFMLGTEYNLFLPLTELIRQWEEDVDLKPGILEKLLYQNAVNILGEELERVGVDLKEWQINLSQV